ncbi:MAG: hypothetical protein ACI8TX_002384 [Hyphomicrobiaceae bacterium]|jgi:hypothetical protein
MKEKGRLELDPEGSEDQYRVPAAIRAQVLNAPPQAGHFYYREERDTFERALRRRIET